VIAERPWLAPLGAVFGGLAALRATLYAAGVFRCRRLQGPVISVGNLRVGGTGKTPLVIRCAELLQGAGLPVSILSRGYGGAFRGDCLLVADGTAVRATAEEAGDEPVMMAEALPGVVVAVGPKRDHVGEEVERRFGVRVHLLDDGFQHLRLSRDLDLLCLGPGDLEGRPLPAGALREFPSAARRADLIFAPQRESEPLKEPARTFRFGRKVEGFVTRTGAPCPPPQCPFLLAGIASPERFVGDVTDRVPRVAGTLTLPDHHRYTRDEVAAIVERAQRAGADAIVTTAKDAVRMPSISSEIPLLVLKIVTQIDDEERFAARLLAVARRAA
jgi:tetraacyldisaccharide 4'-kinase